MMRRSATTLPALLTAPAPQTLAERKRWLERKLRADGWSRAAAVAEVALRFKCKA